jgi:hypothetical protein
VCPPHTYTPHGCPLPGPQHAPKTPHTLAPTRTPPQARVWLLLLRQQGPVHTPAQLPHSPAGLLQQPASRRHPHIAVLTPTQPTPPSHIGKGSCDAMALGAGRPPHQGGTTSALLYPGFQQTDSWQPCLAQLPVLDSGCIILCTCCTLQASPRMLASRLNHRATSC